jgi:ABC-type nitrate/sulfonate/bicarbonate transport system substrate-binding protein
MMGFRISGTGAADWRRMRMERCTAAPRRHLARHWPKRGTLRLGYVPLVDAAPLLVAESLDLFRKHGLDVQLSAELGWGSIREKIVYGELDAAHAPGGLLYSILLGTHAPACRVLTDTILNLQGNAITLSRRLWEKGARDARSLRLMIRSEAPKKPVFAVVSPYSSHNLLLRKWLSRAGIDPDRDVRIAVLPPPLVGEHMQEGQIDGFCVGEPWNSASALAGEGWVAATSADLDPLHPEKVLIATESFIQEKPEEYAAMRDAILEACKYCDKPANRPAVAELLHAERLFVLPIDVLRNSLVGPFETGAGPRPDKTPFVIFHRNDANLTTPARAAWFLEGIVESGVLTVDQCQRRLCLKAFVETMPLHAPKSARTAGSRGDEVLALAKSA